MIEFGFESINWSPYFGHPNADAVGLVKAAAGAGYEWISFDESLLAAHAQAGKSLSDLRGIVEAEGLRVLAIHAMAIGEDLEAALRDCRPLAAAAEALGAPWIQVGATAPLGEKLFETTARVDAMAREAGAALAIEFLPFLEVASIEQTRALIAGANASEAGIVVDSWHFFHGPDEWAELESLRGDEIAFVQFDDHPALASEDLLEETTQNRVYPGDGEFDLSRFARVLTDGGFDGAVGLELLSAAHRSRPAAQVATELLAASRPYWKRAPRS